MTKTIKFFASLGVVAGYGHGNNGSEAAETLTPAAAQQIAAAAWQEAAAAEFAANGEKIYVGAVVTPALTVYNTDWGCPVGGEVSVLITGENNPEYQTADDFRQAVVNVLRRTAQALGQSTTQVTFSEVEMEYLDFRTKPEA